MPNTVFFAWQLDTPSEQNKSFIWNALIKACQAVAPTTHPELSPRPESGTQGVPGSPNIVDTIFTRIRACSVFIADLSFVGSTPQGRKTPNPNVLIELGFAARSIGWDRTILVLNSAFGEAKDLPFDILQHRWPIEYKLTEETLVREKRYAHLTQTITEAIADCARHDLERATSMVQALDTATLDFIAHNEQCDFIEMLLPALTTGQLLTGLDHILAARRLIEIGAIQVVSQPYVGYGWTYDGRRMIQQLNVVHPHVLRVLREHKTSQPPPNRVVPSPS